MADESKDKIMEKKKTKNNMSIGKITGVALIAFFSVLMIVSFVIFSDVGEKILYGKNPPGKVSEYLEYGEIVKSNNYECMESSSLKAKGSLPEFVKEFNKCNAK